MKVYKLRTLKTLADAYFDQQENRPFSVLELCNRLGIEVSLLRFWQCSDKEEERRFANSVFSRVGESWEKGEISPSLATMLYKQYLEEEPFTDDRELIIRIVEDGV